MGLGIIFFNSDAFAQGLQRRTSQQVMNNNGSKHAFENNTSDIKLRVRRKNNVLI
jgi:hypothetical protein